MRFEHTAFALNGVDGRSERLGIGRKRPELKHRTTHRHRLRHGRPGRDLHIVGDHARNRWRWVIECGRGSLRSTRC